MIDRSNEKTLAERATESLVKSIVGVDPNQPAEVEEARKLCRNGNPFPLIGMQWPEFLVTGDDCKHFEGEEGNVWNPCLRFDWWQRLIFTGFFDVTYPELFIKGCTGPGKGACVAVAVNLDFDVFDPCMWYVTADTNTHAVQVMFGEIAKWRNKMRFPSSGRSLTTSITDHERKFISVLNPERSSDGESFSGRHGAKYIFDESSSVPDIFYENACKNATKIVCISNPRTKFGFFRNGFKKLKCENKTGSAIGTLGKRLCVTIGGMDCINVNKKRLKEPRSPIGGIEIDGVSYDQGERIPPEHFAKVRALIPGQMDINQYRSILENANEKWKVQCFAHGWFPDEDPVAQFIMESWLKRHQAFHNEHFLDLEVHAFGLDVARSLDGDETSLACGGRNGLKEFHRFKKDRYPEISREVLRITKEIYGIDLQDGLNPIAIDYGGGYGAGVGDWMIEQGVWVVEHQPGSRARVAPEVCQGQRTEDWYLFSLRLDPKREWGEDPFALPGDPKLTEELLAMTKNWDKTMTKFQALAKEQMKAAFADRRSPDSGDSAMLLWRAVREQDGLDAFLRQCVLGSDVVQYYAGQKSASGEERQGPQNAWKVVEDLADFYGNRSPKRYGDDDD